MIFDAIARDGFPSSPVRADRLIFGSLAGRSTAPRSCLSLTSQEVGGGDALGIHLTEGIKMSEWLVSREAIEANLGKPLSDEQWAEVAEEVSGRVDNFIEEIIDGIVEEVIA